MGEITTSRRTADRKTKAVAATLDPLHAKHRLRATESAAYLAAIVESAEDAIISKTLDGIVTSWNASAERMFGYTAHEMIGQPILRLIPSDRHSEEDLILTRLRAGERIEHYETVRVRKDGRALEVSLTISPVRTRAGKIIGASKIARDITERKRLENELAERVSLLTAVFNAVPDRLSIVDASGEFIQLNAAAARLEEQERGRVPWENRGETLQPRTPEGEPFPVQELPILRALRGESVNGVEVQFRDATGRDRSSLNSAAPFYDSAGELRGAVALAHDVTELRAAERAAVERAAQLDATFNALTDGFFLYDGNGQLMRMNDAARSILALDATPEYATLSPAERAARLNIRDVEDRTLSPEEWGITHILRGETLTDSFDYRITALDGQVKDLAITGGPIYDPAGRVIGAVALLRDATERRRLEREVVERAALLQTTFEAMTDGVLIVHRNGVVRACNDAYRALMGYDPLTEGADLSAEERRVRFQARDAEGRPFPPESWPLRRLLRGETITHETADDLYIRTRDGREIIVNTTGAPLLDASGALIGAVMVMRNVSAQRALQRETRRQAGMLEQAHEAIFLWELDGPILYWNRGAELLYGYTRDEALRRSSDGLLHTQRPISTSAFKKALQRDGEWIGELRQTTQDGRELIVESRHQLLTEVDGRRYVLETCRDITERLKLLDEIRASEERQSFLLALGDRLRALTDPDAIKRAAAEALGVYLGVARAGYGEVDEAGEYLVVEQDWTDGTVGSVGGRHPLAQMGDQTLQEAMAVWDVTVEDFETDPRFADPALRAYFRQLGHRAVDSVTLMKGGRFEAALFVNSVAPRGWTREEHLLLREVAERTWTAVQRARADAVVRRARDELEQRVRERTRELAQANHSLRRLSQQVLEVQERERRTIALELHEEIGQALSGATMMLDMVDHSAGEAATNEERVREAREVIGETLEQVRSLALDLRPGVLDNFGLVPALRWLFERYSRQTGVQVRFSVEGMERRLPGPVEIGVYRLIQEALTNVSRHARVALVAVHLSITADTVTLYVVDSGAGFDADAALTSGRSIGLSGMRERTQLLEGTLTISSLQGEGTTIEASIPLTPAVESEVHEAE